MEGSPAHRGDIVWGAGWAMASNYRADTSSIHCVRAYLVITMSADETLIAPGFKGVLTVGWKGPHSAAFGFNVVAAIFCFLLGRAILAERGGVTVPANNPVPRS
jgi:hypothetical protein